MKFSMKLTPKMESMLWGAVGGAAALAIIGFTFGGWVTGGKAKEMAQQQTDKAVDCGAVADLRRQVSPRQECR